VLLRRCFPQARVVARSDERHESLLDASTPGPDITCITCVFVMLSATISGHVESNVLLSKTMRVCQPGCFNSRQATCSAGMWWLPGNDAWVQPLLASNNVGGCIVHLHVLAPHVRLFCFTIFRSQCVFMCHRCTVIRSRDASLAWSYAATHGCHYLLSCSAYAHIRTYTLHCTGLHCSALHYRVGRRHITAAPLTCHALHAMVPNQT
jgi:hypothetical protein